MENFSLEIESLLTFWFLAVTCSSPIGSSTFSFLASYISQQPFPGWCGRCHLFVYTLCGNSDPVRTLCLVHGLYSSRWFMVGPYSSFLVGLCRFGISSALLVLVGYVLIGETPQILIQPKLMGDRLNMSRLVVVASLFIWRWFLGCRVIPGDRESSNKSG